MFKHIHLEKVQFQHNFNAVSRKQDERAFFHAIGQNAVELNNKPVCVISLKIEKTV